MKGRNCGFNCKHFHGTCDFDENGVMNCFEPTENIESLNNLDESITNLLENYDS